MSNRPVPESAENILTYLQRLVGPYQPCFRRSSAAVNQEATLVPPIPNPTFDRWVHLLVGRSVVCPRCWPTCHRGPLQMFLNPSLTFWMDPNMPAFFRWLAEHHYPFSEAVPISNGVPFVIAWLCLLRDGDVKTSSTLWLQLPLVFSPTALCSTDIPRNRQQPARHLPVTGLWTQPQLCLELLHKGAPLPLVSILDRTGEGGWYNKCTWTSQYRRISRLPLGNPIGRHHAEELQLAAHYLVCSLAPRRFVRPWLGTSLAGVVGSYLTGDSTLQQRQTRWVQAVDQLCIHRCLRTTITGEAAGRCWVCGELEQGTRFACRECRRICFQEDWGTVPSLETTGEARVWDKRTQFFWLNWQTKSD